MVYKAEESVRKIKAKDWHKEEEKVFEKVCYMIRVNLTSNINHFLWSISIEWHPIVSIYV